MGDQDKKNTSATPTIAELMAKNEALEQELADLKAAVSEVNAAEYQALVQQSEEQENKIQELLATIEALKTNTAAQPVEPYHFTHDNVTYKINVKKMDLDGKIVTADELMQDHDMRTDLLNFAWEGRTEETFNDNGIFSIVY